MLDLRGNVCYNVITSERFFFFVKNRLTVNIRAMLSVARASGTADYQTEGGVYFYGVGYTAFSGKSKKYFRKAGGAVMRVKITLACTECKQRNYNTMKNKKNDPDRLEMNKYCRFCRKHTLHKETK